VRIYLVLGSAFDKLLLAFKQQDLEDAQRLNREDTRRILISSLGNFRKKFLKIKL
jgi:hypothetical protein